MNPTKKLNLAQIGFGTQLPAAEPDWSAAQNHDAATIAAWRGNITLGPQFRNKECSGALPADDLFKILSLRCRSGSSKVELARSELKKPRNAPKGAPLTHPAQETCKFMHYT